MSRYWASVYCEYITHNDAMFVFMSKSLPLLKGIVEGSGGQKYILTFFSDDRFIFPVSKFGLNDLPMFNSWHFMSIKFLYFRF